jgi:hypothetical protein
LVTHRLATLELAARRCACSSGIDDTLRCRRVNEVIR